MKILFPIFLLALFIRFLYFPDNVNFAYDQARDSFASLEILKGDFKILGPPTTAGATIFHGALIYYVLAPIYFFSGNNPEVAAAIFRVVNALGVFLVFYIGRLIFNNYVGLLSALLFALSFEQSQYSLFFGHPALGVFTILIFYLGLALWIFKDRPIGFVIALAGLGLTLQFEDANIPLILVFLLYLLIFHKQIKTLNMRTIFLGSLTFILTISTFILAEIKYNFRMSQAILSAISGLGVKETDYGDVWMVIQRFIHDNFLANQTLVPLLLIGFVISAGYLIRNHQNQIIFLAIWFLGGISTHMLNPSFTYYYSPGATVSLLIFVSLLIYLIFRKRKILAIIIFGIIIYSNLFLVINLNSKGPGSDIVIQAGMLTINQRRALDYMYEKANQEPFAVNALTVPLNVKTTWDYLFNWYGEKKYGYVPVWQGDSAAGFYGNLEIVNNRSELPEKRFTIIEPTVGIDVLHIDEFFRIENYFSKVIEKRHFGTIIVEVREVI